MSEETTKKARKAKKVQKFVVGKWVADADGNNHFEPSKRQPEVDVTDINEMIAWTKANLADEPGRYQFIRELVGSLVIAQQMNLKFTFE